MNRDFSDEIKKDVEQSYYYETDEKKSLNNCIWQSAYDALQCWGHFSVFCRRLDTDDERAYDGKISWEGMEAEDVIIDKSYAEICLHELRTDEGLRVIPTRNEYGILERITVTLKYDEE